MEVSVDCGFKPIELTIRIETPEELNELYARLNAPIKNVKGCRFIEDLGLKYGNIQPLLNVIKAECERCFGKD